jgi:hypothetical protein
VVKEHIKNAKRSLIQREKKILIIGSVSKHGRLIDVRLHNLESLHKNNHKKITNIFGGIPVSMIKKKKDIQRLTLLNEAAFNDAVYILRRLVLQ